MMFMNGKHMITKAVALSSPVSTVHTWNAWDHEPPFGNQTASILWLSIPLEAQVIITSVTYGILTWANCSMKLLSHLHTVHSRAVRIIYNLDLSLPDAECLLTSSWPPIFFYKKHFLIFWQGWHVDLSWRKSLADLFVQLNRLLYPGPSLKLAGTPYGIKDLPLNFQRALPV